MYVGMPAGYKIKFNGGWEEFPGTESGDLIFRLQTQTHPLFRRDGNDLHTTLEISLVEALTEFKKEIVHLDGHTVMISRANLTPPGSFFYTRSLKGREETLVKCLIKMLFFYSWTIKSIFVL